MLTSPLTCAAVAVSAIVIATSDQVTPRDQDHAAAGDVLSSSEIRLVESGGLTGRSREARLVANEGRVTVEYRSFTAPAKATELPSDRYLALWRELEQADVWRIADPRRTQGADLVESELHLRLGLMRAHRIRWDETSMEPRIHRLMEIARRILSTAREATSAR
jgi:hypothetical protein